MFIIKTRTVRLSNPKRTKSNIAAEIAAVDGCISRPGLAAYNKC